MRHVVRLMAPEDTPTGYAGDMSGARGVVLLVVAGCSGGSRQPAPPPEAPASPEEAAADEAEVSWPTAAEVPALARAFYGSLTIIHATSDDPDADDTPFLEALRPCQIEPARALEHPGLARFFPGARFFASTCADGGHAVVSIDPRRQVRLVSLEPHERLYAGAWDEITGGPVNLATIDDVKLFASAFIALTYLEEVPVAELTVTPKEGTGTFAGTHYVEVESRAASVTLASQDRHTYSVASHGRRD